MASDADGKNLDSLICVKCKSMVLRNNNGKSVKKSIELPTITLSKEDKKPTYEQFDELWFVKDVMTFENVGIAKAQNGIRYLCCADCEHGPFGIQTDSGYFLAHKRLGVKVKLAA